MARNTAQPENLAQQFKAACASAKARLHFGIAQVHEQLQQLFPGEPITTEALFRNCLASLSDKVSFSKVYRVQKLIKVIAKSGRAPLITDFIEKRGSYDRGGKKISDDILFQAWLIADTMRRRKNGTLGTVAKMVLRGLLKPGQRMVSQRTLRRRIRSILRTPKYAVLLKKQHKQELIKIPGNNMVPGEHWAMDTYAIDISAPEYRGGQGEWKVTEIVDIGSLVVLAAILTVGEPDVQALLLVLLMAMEPLPLFEYQIIPKSLRTDRGSVFTSNIFEARLAAMGIMHSLTPAHCPRANSHSEKSHKNTLAQLYFAHNHFPEREAQHQSYLNEVLGDKGMNCRLILESLEAAIMELNLRPVRKFGGLSPAMVLLNQVKHSKNPANFSTVLQNSLVPKQVPVRAHRIGLLGNAVQYLVPSEIAGKVTVYQPPWWLSVQHFGPLLEASLGRHDFRLVNIKSQDDPDLKIDVAPDYLEDWKYWRKPQGLVVFGHRQDLPVTHVGGFTRPGRSEPAVKPEEVSKPKKRAPKTRKLKKAKV